MLVSVCKFNNTARDIVHFLARSIGASPETTERAAVRLPDALRAVAVESGWGRDGGARISLNLARQFTAEELWPDCVDNPDLASGLGKLFLELALEHYVRIDLIGCEQRWLFSFTQEFAFAVFDQSALPSREMVPRMRRAHRLKEQRSHG